MSVEQIDPWQGARHRRPRTTTAARGAGTVLTAAVLLAAAFVLAVAVLLPRIGGATPYTVLTDSMRPAYPPGTMLVVRPVAADDIALGTVITFQVASGQPTVATHRVVTIARRPDGELRFLTKGDANAVPDQQWVRPEQVRGALWYAVPRLGYVSELLTGEQRQRGVVVVAVVLLGYAALMAAGGARDRRRARESA
ncbi:MAG: signal peptidase [Pseudonocardiales bacterium]|nr:signal peptidase [Pseudonocardiales bacterium]